MAKSSDPRYQLNLTEGELDVLETILDFHKDDEPGEMYPAGPFETLSRSVTERTWLSWTTSPPAGRNRRGRPRPQGPRPRQPRGLLRPRRLDPIPKPHQ